MYNPKSGIAEEFINHEEVLASLEYAQNNKNNVELIDKILDFRKSTLRKRFNSQRGCGFIRLRNRREKPRNF